MYQQNLIYFSFIDIKRQQCQLVCNEKEKIKTELKSSFDEINRTVLKQDRLKEILEKRKGEYLTIFDEATEGVDQKLECKPNAKRELENFANEKIIEIIEKNKGISSFIATGIVCNVSACLCID